MGWIIESLNWIDIIRRILDEMYLRFVANNFYIMKSSNIDIDIPALLSVAEEAACGAGELAQAVFSQPRNIESKGFRDIVTDADLAAQSKSTETILQKFPNHGFLTEEKDNSLRSNGPIIWIIDPIDGTTNYSRQIPVYSVSIAAAINRSSTRKGRIPNIGEVLCGAIYDPVRKELFSAGLGLGCWHKTNDGEDMGPISVSSIEAIDTAMVGLDWGRSFKSRRGMLDALERFLNEAHSVRAMGSAALGLAWVAAGRLDVYYNAGIGPWDVAAAKVLLQEAGGRLTTQDGTFWQLGDNGCVASNGLVHDAFLSLLVSEKLW